MSRGPSRDLKPQIDSRVAAQPGAVWTPVDFLDLAPRAAIDKSLQRLVADGTLSRVDRGLYYRPGTNTLTGKLTTPDVRAIVDAVARRDQTRVVVDGLTAANDLGLYSGAGTCHRPHRRTITTDQNRESTNRLPDGCTKPLVLGRTPGHASCPGAVLVARRFRL